jgi:RsiW-degrading membrane proteinase PrsW (M82 family)
VYQPPFSPQSLAIPHFYFVNLGTMSCTLCQEAREAKAAGLEMIDLCSGEKLPDLSLRAPSNTLIDGSSVHSQSGTENALSSLPTMQYISKTSYIIITASTMIVLITTMTLLGAGRIGPLLILILAFLQPVVVLYYIYYKDHRHSIPLDSVIKIFAIGFFLTTFQSAIIEEVLQSVFILVFAPMLPQAISTSNDDVNDKNISGSHDNHHPLSSMGINFVTSGSSSLFYSHHDQMDSDNHGISYTGVKNPLSVGLYNTVMYCVSFIQDAMSTSNTFAYDTHPYTAFSYSSSLEADIATSGSAASIGEESENNGDLKSNMATHMFLFIVIFAVLAFVIAAGVEETMKQFIVRCHHFGTPLKDPYTIMVYLMTGALGFTVMENISYVFNSQHSPVPGTSLFVGELMVLLLRVCLPVHLICSVLQSVNLSKIVMGQEINMSLFVMLLPAILLHGSFDFILFFMSFLGFVYNLDTIWYECITFVIAASIAGGGAYVAWDRWKRVTHDFEYGFSQIDATSTHSMGDSGDRSGNPMHSSQV